MYEVLTLNPGFLMSKYCREVNPCMHSIACLLPFFQPGYWVIFIQGSKCKANSNRLATSEDLDSSPWLST
jgi:hypothetical protein